MQIYLFSICLHAYEGSVCPTSGFNTSDLQNILKLKTHFTIWSLFTVNNAHITYSNCYFSRQIGLQGNAYYLKHVHLLFFWYLLNLIFCIVYVHASEILFTYTFDDFLSYVVYLLSEMFIKEYLRSFVFVFHLMKTLSMYNYLE